MIAKVNEMYQKDLNMSYLLDFYGEAIPEKQKEILSEYYNEDLSLAEIAQNFDISRQGARHLIKKGEEHLIFLEEKLGLAKLHKDATRYQGELADLLDVLEEHIRANADVQSTLSILDRVRFAAEKIKID